MRALVADDDRVTAEILSRTLVRWEFEVTTVDNGAAAWAYLRAAVLPTLAVLDWMMPEMDGPEVCRRVRTELPLANMYLMLLTARESRGDLVTGLDAGADDYLTKPFSFSELLARVRALVRRRVSERPAIVVVGDLALDPAARRVTRGDLAVELTAKEFALLEYFMRRPGEVLTRSRIIEHVWDFGYDGDSNVVDVYVRYLREKIDRPFRRDSIETVRGSGYRLREVSDGATDPR